MKIFHKRQKNHINTFESERNATPLGYSETLPRVQYTQVRSRDPHNAIRTQLSGYSASLPRDRWGALGCLP